MSQKRVWIALFTIFCRSWGSVIPTASAVNGLSVDLAFSSDPFSNVTINLSDLLNPARDAVSSGTRQPSILDVQVGADGQLAFSPNQISADVGDTVKFHFHALNHSISEMAFDKPCVPSNGFQTGFEQYNPSDSADILVAFTINSPNPRYFFCHQTLPVDHCSSGMVFAINAGSTADKMIQNVLQLSGSTTIPTAGASSSTSIQTAPLLSTATATGTTISAVSSTGSSIMSVVSSSPSTTSNLGLTNMNTSPIMATSIAHVEPLPQTLSSFLTSSTASGLSAVETITGSSTSIMLATNPITSGIGIPGSSFSTTEVAVTTSSPIAVSPVVDVPPLITTKLSQASALQRKSSPAPNIDQVKVANGSYRALTGGISSLTKFVVAAVALVMVI